MSLDEDARWLEWMTKQFESIAGDDKEIDLDEFKTALKVKEVRQVGRAGPGQVISYSTEVRVLVTVSRAVFMQYKHVLCCKTSGSIEHY